MIKKDGKLSVELHGEPRKYGSYLKYFCFFVRFSLSTVRLDMNFQVYES